MRLFYPISLVLTLPALGLAEVTAFTNCPQFFANRIHPTILDRQNHQRYRQICQCRVDQNSGRPVYYYATLYDATYKIPVYSAYQFRRYVDNKRQDPWYIEPQLDGANNQCMGAATLVPPANRGLHQAMNTDYSVPYDKGHLYPVYHTDTWDAMMATSTLTNAAPQNSTFNRGQWKKYEDDVAGDLGPCDSAFIITGVVPGNTQIGADVRVSRFYWSAYCCFQRTAPRSRGFIGPDNNGRVKNITVGTLEAELSHYYGQTFSVFNGGC